MDKKLLLFKQPSIEDANYVVDTIYSGVTSLQNPLIPSFVGQKVFDIQTGLIHTAQYSSNQAVGLFWDNGVGVVDNKFVFCDGHTYLTNGTNNIEVTYSDVIPISIPNGRKIEIYSFSYSASRMGQAPTISATYEYEKCLDDFWTFGIYTRFNGERFFIDKTPTSSYSNYSTRYKHEITFTSERILLENVYFINQVVQTGVNDIPVGNWTSFCFFGTLNTVADRLNYSMDNSNIGENDIGFHCIVDQDAETQGKIQELIADGEYEIMFSYNEVTIIDVLNDVYDKYEIPYYFVSNPDGQYRYEIHFGFSTEPSMLQDGVQFPVFEYGINEHLLSIKKNNTTTDFVNRCTGIGGEENIPYYYPNTAPNGLVPYYRRGNADIVGGVEVINPYRIGRCPSTTESQLTTTDDHFIYKNIEVVQNFNQLDSININTSKTTLASNYSHSVILGYPYDPPVPNIAWITKHIRIKLKGYVTEFTIKDNFISDDSIAFVADVLYWSYWNTKFASKNSIDWLDSYKEYKTSDIWAYVASNEDIRRNLLFLEDTEQNRNKVKLCKSFIGYPESGFLQKDYSGDINNGWIPPSTYNAQDDIRKFIEKLSITKSSIINTIENPILLTEEEINGCDECLSLVNEFIEIFSNAYSFEDISSIIMNAALMVFAVDKIQYRYWKDNNLSTDDYSVTYEDSQTFNNIDEYKSSFPKTYSNIGDTETCIHIKVSYRIYGSNYDNNWDNCLMWTHALAKYTTRISGSYKYLASYWTLHDNIVNLGSYGLYSSEEQQLGDIIYLVEENRMPYITHLMPPIYRSDRSIWYNAKNLFYNKIDSTQQNPIFYSFNEEYRNYHAKEHFESFDDIKPTIKGARNAQGQRIDTIIDVAFDEYDNNIINENGEYDHPYFFVKIRKTSSNNAGGGFNLFRSAVDGSNMTFNITSGLCGGCSFEIGVLYNDDGLAYNPVVVYEAAVDGHNIGDLKRDANGNVIRNGSGQSIQNDTSLNEVWIALKKDTETYSGGSFSNVMPIKDTIQPSNGDTFVLTNILLPFMFITEAEQRLEYAILDYMEEKNPEVWSFNVSFSRIYYEQNFVTLDKWLNESSKVKVKYNEKIVTYFVSSYTYKMDDTSPLPQVSIELTEKVKTHKRRKKYNGNIDLERVSASTVVTELPTRNTTYNPLTNSTIIYGGATITGSAKVLGDVVFGNEKSLTNTITTFNEKSIEAIKKDDLKYEWNNISDRVDLFNLFKDGAFRYNYNNNIEKTDVEVSEIETETSVLGGRSLFVSFADGSENKFVFGQKIKIDIENQYTVSFSIKLQTDIRAFEDKIYENEKALLKLIGYITDNDGNILCETNTSSNIIFTNNDWNERIFKITFDKTELLEEYENLYMQIGFSKNTYSKPVDVYIDCIQVFDMNLTDVTKEGVVSKNELFPKKFTESEYEYQLAYKNVETQQVADFFSYSWTSLSNSIIVKHNLNKKPAVSVTDTAGTEIICDVIYIDNNTIELVFSSPARGTVYCN